MRRGYILRRLNEIGCELMKRIEEEEKGRREDEYWEKIGLMIEIGLVKFEFREGEDKERYVKEKIIRFVKSVVCEWRGMDIGEKEDGMMRCLIEVVEMSGMLNCVGVWMDEGEKELFLGSLLWLRVMRSLPLTRIYVTSRMRMMGVMGSVFGGKMITKEGGLKSGVKLLSEKKEREDEVRSKGLETIIWMIGGENEEIGYEMEVWEKNKERRRVLWTLEEEDGLNYFCCLSCSGGEGDEMRGINRATGLCLSVQKK
jgi:hypothetical protein